MNNQLEQWEYFTTLIETEMAQIDAHTEAMIPSDQDHPKYSPYATMPELNRLGQKGWELMSMQPVIAGKNHDILVHPNNFTYWSHTYLCVFKRRL
jgi:hypothetical protein